MSSATRVPVVTAGQIQLTDDGTPQPSQYAGDDTMMGKPAQASKKPFHAEARRRGENLVEEFEDNLLRIASKCW